VLFQDIRFGLRTAMKNRGVTAAAVLCLAIGIGLNTMMFSVVDGVLIEPLPYKDPSTLVHLYTTNQRSGIRRGNLSWLELQDWRARASAFTTIAAVQFRSMTVSDRGDPQRYSGAAISHELFPMLGVSPQIGRNFSADDDRQGGEPVVLISDDLWRTRYGADPSIIGRAIELNARPHTVIGVMPPGFAFPVRERIWVPLAEYAVSQERGERGLQAFARLSGGVSIAQAREQANAVAASLAAAFPSTNDGWGAGVRSIVEWAIPADVRLIILTMMGAVTLVLLIACFNVANLTLARASTRAREMSIRTALGAKRGQMLRQLLTESVIIGLLSVPLGLACAWGGLRLMDTSIPPDAIPYFIHWSLNARAFAYATAIAVATGIVFGLAPAVQASKADLQHALREGGRGTTGAGRAWLRNGLVVAEVCLSLVLLIGASLFMRSFVNLQRASAGFDTAPLLTMRFYMPAEQYPTDVSKTRRVEDILRRIQALPGVQTAFASNLVPLGGGGGDARIVIDGHPTRKGEEPDILFTGVTAHLYDTLGLHLVRGRDVTPTEALSRAPVAVVNDTMARRFWPKEDPIGRRFRTLDDDATWFTVVGIVPDIRQYNLDTTEPVEPCAYVAYPFGATPNTGITIRTAGDPALLTAAAREQIRASDPTLAVFQVSTMEALRQRGYWQFFLFGWMFGLFGIVALMLAAIGVYGVLSYSVSQRIPEIGVRVALGASRGSVLGMVLGGGLRLAAIGIVLGVAGSFMITPVIESQLYNVSPTDPISFAAVSLFLAATASLASYIPARRATSVDPLEALRAE
jgi:putative ABC transport system permease protein